MTHDLFTISSDLLPPDARVVAFRGTEALSRPYELVTHVLVPADHAHDLDLAALLHQRATLSFHHEDGSPRQWLHGIVAAAELCEDLPTVSLYRLVLVPRLWELSLSEHSWVWVKTSVPDVIESVFKRAGLTGEDYALALTRSYPPRDHVCQYHERDLDFVCRWMEREGITFYFDHSGDRERLILADDRSHHVPLATAPVRVLPAGDSSGQEGLSGLRRRRVARPTAVRLKGYDYQKPALGLSGQAKAAPGGPGGAVVRHDPDLATPDEAKRLARVSAEELLAGQVLYRGAGRVYDARSGYLFTVDEHPRPELNREYLAVAIEHRGLNLAGAAGLAALLGEEDADARTYTVQIEAIASDVQFRPEARTPTPRVDGYEIAVVDGPQTSEYAQVDAHGRYLVRIGFDEGEPADGKASMRVRMLQPHGGAPEGFHFPLRKGTEVLLQFLAGDPDQPVIAGVVPNSDTPSPVTAENHTHNVVQTGGRSRLDIEDQDGAQFVDTSTPPENTFVHLGAHHGAHTHNVVISTDGDGLIRTGGNRDVTVDGDQTEDVQGDLTEDYRAHQTTHVFASFDETIDAGATQTIHGSHTQTIDGGLKQDILGGETRTVTGGVDETVNGNRTQTIVGASTETVTGSLSQAITGGATITTPASYTINAVGGFELTTAGAATFVAPGGYKMFAPGGQAKVDNFFSAAGFQKLASFGFGFGGYFTKIDNAALIFSAVQFKIEATQFKMGMLGLKFGKPLDESKITGIWARMGGLKVWTSGVQIFT